jgi:hypothetical protein
VPRCLTIACVASVKRNCWAHMSPGVNSGKGLLKISIVTARHSEQVPEQLKGLVSLLLGLRDGFLLLLIKQTIVKSVGVL